MFVIRTEVLTKKALLAPIVLTSALCKLEKKFKLFVVVFKVLYIQGRSN